MEHVRESIDTAERGRFHCNGSAKQSQVRQIETKLIETRAHVSGSLGARIQMPQAHRHQVDIVQHDTRKARLGGVLKSNVKQHCPIEGLRIVLLNQKDAIVDALLAQIVVHVDEEVVELLFACSVHHDDGSAEGGRTIGRKVFATQTDVVSWFNELLTILWR